MTVNNESLGKATKELLLEEPFMGLFLAMLNKEWDDSVTSAGVYKNGINVGLKLNPYFWDSLSPLWQKMVLKECVLHICLFHLETRSELADKDIADIAANVVVNQMIDPSWLPLHDVKYKDFRDLHEELRELLRDDIKYKRKTEEEVIAEYRKLPPRGCYLQDFHELNMEPDKDMRYYYEMLLQAKDKPPGQGGSEALNDMLGDKVDGLPEGWSHDWAEFEGLSEAESKLLRAQTETMLKQVAEEVLKSRGTIPGNIQAILDAINAQEPAKFDWRRYIRRFAGGSAKTHTKLRKNKMNRRYPGMPGLRIKQNRRVIVAVDTSGSVSDFELQEFFHEIYHLTKTGTEVDVLQFDYGIESFGPFQKNYVKEGIKIAGRGGTDFQMPFDYINEHHKKYACAIFVSDGEAPAPVGDPKLRLLWVHSSKSNINESLPGFKIKLPS